VPNANRRDPAIPAFFCNTMNLALSTRWNAYRHASGEALADEILAAGFSRVELGYDFRLDLLDGLRSRLASGQIRVGSLHAPCPIPLGLPSGHPEYFTLADPDESERATALRLVRDTVQLAADLGASVVVAHAGNVKMPRYSYRIQALTTSRRPDGWWTRRRLARLRAALDLGRMRAVPVYLDALSRSLEALLPDLDAAGITLALENLPTWESIPTEVEMAAILERFPTPHLAAWHDIGHGIIREKLGFSLPLRWLEKIAPRVAGMHVHDVDARLNDHLAPGQGAVDFTRFRPWSHTGLTVLEVRPGLPVEALKAGLDTMRAAWDNRPESDLETISQDPPHG